MQKLFKELHDRISSGEDAVLVTIVASSGSTPRGSGARMLMTKEGHIAGTVGGGAVEYECEKLALKALENKGSTSEYFRLHKNDVADIGMICGGDVDVYFKYIPAGDEYMISLTQKIDEMFEKGEQCWLITEITEDNNGIVSVYSKKNGVIGKDISNEVIEKISNRPVQIETETTKYYCEKLVQAGRVIIIGGGHVSQQLVPTLARCDFRTMVVESRKEFANPALFEGVNEVRLVNMEDMSEIVSEVTEDDYICIMTRGHKDDYVAQRNLLKTPACYIGVIGSRHKVAGVNAKLKADGFTDEDINRITTPIGIDICSETPAEIAVAITAQLIELRAKRNDTRKFRTRG